mgnify:CR=1 FL=1
MYFNLDNILLYSFRLISYQPTFLKQVTIHIPLETLLSLNLDK